MELTAGERLAGGALGAAREGHHVPSTDRATIVPLIRSGRARPTLPDPLEDPTAVATIASVAVLELIGPDDAAIARRIDRGRRHPITAAIVARWRAGLAIPDLPTFLQLVALAGASALGCLAGLPFDG